MPPIEKHPQPASVTEDSTLEGPLLKINLTVYAEIILLAHINPTIRTIEQTRVLGCYMYQI